MTGSASNVNTNTQNHDHDPSSKGTINNTFPPNVPLANPEDITTTTSTLRNCTEALLRPPSKTQFSTQPPYSKPPNSLAGLHRRLSEFRKLAYLCDSGVLNGCGQEGGVGRGSGVADKEFTALREAVCDLFVALVVGGMKAVGERRWRERIQAWENERTDEVDDEEEEENETINAEGEKEQEDLQRHEQQQEPKTTSPTSATQGRRNPKIRRTTPAWRQLATETATTSTLVTSRTRFAAKLQKAIDRIDGARDPWRMDDGREAAVRDPSLTGGVRGLVEYGGTVLEDVRGVGGGDGGNYADQIGKASFAATEDSENNERGLPSPNIPATFEEASSQPGSSSATESMDENKTDLNEDKEQQSYSSDALPPPPPREYSELMECYICGHGFTRRHHFYPLMCVACGAINYRQRLRRPSLVGHVALVTGGRVKVGFATVIKLLECQADLVIVTTRFPNDAARRLASHPLFRSSPSYISQRVHIYGLDLRDLCSVRKFVRCVARRYGDRLSIVVQNAAQTFRKPAAFYAHLADVEAGVGAEEHGAEVWGMVQRSWEESEAAISDDSELRLGGGNKQKSREGIVDPMEVFDPFGRILQALETQSFAADNAEKKEHLPLENGDLAPKSVATSTSLALTENKSSSRSVPTATSTITIPSHALSLPNNNPITLPVTLPPVNRARISRSALLSFIPMDPAMDSMPRFDLDRYFPPGQMDQYGAPLDLRQQTSWTAVLPEISDTEILESFVVNAIAPTILQRDLAEVMARRVEKAIKSRTETSSNSVPLASYIINVTAKEGIFFSSKNGEHPHSNMCKAALNMLTRTTALWYANKKGVYINAVDPGWSSVCQPVRSLKECLDKGKVIPLDEVDSAARILHPIFEMECAAGSSSSSADVGFDRTDLGCVGSGPKGRRMIAGALFKNYQA
ncbi:hypothetical protein HK102_001753, partial [Quaeritorhiza haematococci]